MDLIVFDDVGVTSPNEKLYVRIPNMQYLGYSSNL